MNRGGAVRKRVLTLLTAISIAVFPLAACSSGLGGSSSCADYLNASSEDQQRVVDDLAAKYHKPDYTSPLGFPEVAYACSSQPKMTLDEFFERAQ